MGKETLGFPTRTAAVVALRKQGHSTPAIAGMVGIEPKTVTALEASASRCDTVQDKERSKAEIILPLSVRTKLRGPARRRDLTVDRLALMIIDAVAEGNLVDAVLDDRGEVG